MQWRTDLSQLKKRDFPDWVTIQALSLLDFYIQASESAEPPDDIDSRIDAGTKKRMDDQHALNIQAIIRCYQSEYMKEVWEFASGIYEKKPEKGQIWLSLVLWVSLIRTMHFAKTKTGAEKWKKALIKNLKAAHKLSLDTPDNYSTWVDAAIKRFDTLLIEANPMTPSRIRKGIKSAAPPDLLASMIKALEETNYDTHFMGSHVNRETASRQKAARCLTNAFLVQTGKSKRKLVADIISTAFDCEAGESEVKRWSRGIAKNNVQDILSVSEKKYIETGEGLIELEGHFFII